MSPKFAYARALSKLFALAVCLLVVYFHQLAEANEYMGYRMFVVDLSYVVTSVTSVFLIGLLMPTTIRKPSDFFTFLYGLFVLLPYITLYPIRNMVEPQIFILQFAILLGPFFIVRSLKVVDLSLKLPTFITTKTAFLLVVALCVTGTFLALTNPPASAGFDLITSYARRIEGRDIYTAGTPLAYLNATIANGFVPLLAFSAGLNRRVWLLMLCLFCAISYFYLLGLKAPLLYMSVALIIGRLVRKGKIQNMVRLVYTLLFVVFGLFFVEQLTYGYSFIGDFFIRRSFSVPAYLVSAYFEFMSGTLWDPLQGIISSEFVTFAVGERVLGLPGANANTNAFVNPLAAGGFPMYVFTIMLVFGVFWLLDATYAYRRNPVFLYLGFSYAILLTEQGATTALVSSGLGILIFLAIFSGKTDTGTYPRSKASIVKGS